MLYEVITAPLQGRGYGGGGRHGSPRGGDGCGGRDAGTETHVRKTPPFRHRQVKDGYRTGRARTPSPCRQRGAEQHYRYQLLQQRRSGCEKSAHFV